MVSEVFLYVSAYTKFGNLFNPSLMRVRKIIKFLRRKCLAAALGIVLKDPALTTRSNPQLTILLLVLSDIRRGIKKIFAVSQEISECLALPYYGSSFDIQSTDYLGF